MQVVFDIGGTSVRAAAVEAPGRIRPLGQVPTPRDDFAAFAAALSGLMPEGTRGIALSIAGVVDPDGGRAKVANIPCIDGRPLGDDLAAALGVPVIVANDADCFALAEARTGAGVGHRVVMGLILGSGVGGGIVIDGRIHNGAGGYAGEWGHGPVVRPGALPVWRCGCGLDGCLDAVGSARGLERIEKHLGGARDAVAILRDWLAGELRAVQAVDLWRDAVAGPLAMVVNVIGASVMPVGGGLGNVVELIASLDAAVRPLILRKTDAPLIVPAMHRDNPGMIGASLLAAEAFGDA